MLSFKERVQLINDSLLPEREAIKQARVMQRGKEFAEVNLTVLAFGGARFNKKLAKALVKWENAQ